MNYKITGSGSYIPTVVQKNKAFIGHSFIDNQGMSPFQKAVSDLLGVPPPIKLITSERA